MKEREDNFIELRKALRNFTDLELKEHFFLLSDKIVDPLLELGQKYTSKSIERSVLLRMGFSSIEAKSIVDLLHEHRLLRKGAGHCVYIISKDKELSIREAGIQIGEGHHIDYLLGVFKKNGKTKTKR